MKYIDKVIKVNSDGENYEYGVRLELSDLELQILFNTLENAIDLEDNPLYNQQKGLLNKFMQLYQVKHNGYLRNVDIEE